MDPKVVYPSVFVVEGHAHSAPVVKEKKRSSLLQPALLLLVLLALAGLAVEGYFLRGFQEDLQTLTSQLTKRVNVSFEKVIQEQKSKSGNPAAHVTGAQNTVSGEGPLLWEPELGEAFLHEVGYAHATGSLVFNRTGNYFLYSKVQLGVLSCQDPGPRRIIHRICKRTPRYQGEITLMEGVKQSCEARTEQWWDSSFLGGIFQLEEEEQVYVNVDKKELVRVTGESRSYFGGFMV
ncbi:tumor necrosis factor ligand superfamily member 14 [Ambystoma mexicanum]|uniref:tumor necrosis factor ligand superfamily member 14 n=1 Tax=Ambystoma mexicanum TaxID=8296 RepID=UPI0037E95EF4